VKNLYLIAEITSFDNKGFAKLKLFARDIERFDKIKELYIEISGNYKKLKVEEVKFKSESAYLKFLGFDEKDDFEVLLNRKLYLDKKSLRQLVKREFFAQDLMYCDVVYKGKVIGYISDVLCLKANDVLTIRNNDGKEYMIPFVSDFVKEVDLKKKEVILTDRDLEFYDED